MADSLPLQPQRRPDTPSSDTETSLGSAPTLTGSLTAGGGGQRSEASTASGLAGSAATGDSILELKQRLQMKKQALSERKQQLEASALHISRSDEGSNDPENLRHKLMQLRERLDTLEPMLANLDADYKATADYIAGGKTSPSETELQLISAINNVRRTIRSEEMTRLSLEQRLRQLQQEAQAADEAQRQESFRQQRELEKQLVSVLGSLETNKLDACYQMHEAAALMARAQRHGEATEPVPGYMSDQGASSGYASEAASSRTPHACESHPLTDWGGPGVGGGPGGGGRPAGVSYPGGTEAGPGGGAAGFSVCPKNNYPCTSHLGMDPWTSGAGTDTSDAGDESARSLSAPCKDKPTADDVIMPWNMRPASNYYFVPPGLRSHCTPTESPAAEAGWSKDTTVGAMAGATTGTMAATMGGTMGGTLGGDYVPPPDDADYDGPEPYTTDSLQRVFDDGIRRSLAGATGHYPDIVQDPVAASPAPSAAPPDPASSAGTVLAHQASSGMLGAEDWASYTQVSRPSDSAGHAYSAAGTATHGLTMRYAENLAWNEIGPTSKQPGQMTPPTPEDQEPSRPQLPTEQSKNGQRAALPTTFEGDARPVILAEFGPPILTSNYMENLSMSPQHYPTSLMTPAGLTAPLTPATPPSAGSAEPRSPPPPPPPPGQPMYATGLNWDSQTSPSSRVTPSCSLETHGPYGLTSHEQILGVAQHLMSRVPSAASRAASSGPTGGPEAYLSGSILWPRSPLTPIMDENVLADVRRHPPPPPPAVAEGGGAAVQYAAGLWPAPENWPESASLTTPMEGVVRAQPRPLGATVTTQNEHSSSETLVREEGSPRSEEMLPWNMKTQQLNGDAGSEPWSSPRSTAGPPSAGYEPAQGEYGYQRYPQGSEPPQMWYGHERASLPSEAGSDVAPVTDATSDGYAQSAIESDYAPSLGSDLTSVDPDGESHWHSDHPDTQQPYDDSAQPPPPPPPEASPSQTPSKAPSDAGALEELYGDSGDAQQPDGYEPAQGEYGYQRYPQGYELPQMWYGHDRASLEFQERKKDAMPSPTMPNNPASIPESDKYVFEEIEALDRMEPDTTRTLANILQGATSLSLHMTTGAKRPAETAPASEESKPYEPAQGEYGYQRFPQGYEPPQMWYGHDRACLPSDQAPEATAQPASDAPTSQAKPETSPFENEHDFDRIEPDTTRTLARILGGDSMPVVRKRPAEEGPGEAPPPAKILSEGYEPAQGEYGYQRYPQGYQTAQMWYGHEEAALSQQTAEGKDTPSSELHPATAIGEEETYEGVSPGNTKTPEKVINDAVPYLAGERLDSEVLSGAAAPIAETQSGGYEPAQGEYGYQRYPQGYETAQMWYGHEQTTLTGQCPSKTEASSAQPAPAVELDQEEDFDGASPDTTQTLEKIFQKGTPHAKSDAVVAVERQNAAESTGKPPDEEPALLAAVVEEYPSYTRQDYTRSDTSLVSRETLPASSSMEYIPASGMYGFQPPVGPPSRGSEEHLPLPDGTYTQGLCAFSCPELWPPTPPTPGSKEDVSVPSGQSLAKEVAPKMAAYTVGLRWDTSEEWPPSPQTPVSEEDLQKRSASSGPLPAVNQYTSGLRWDTRDRVSPTAPTPDSKETLPRAEQEGGYEPAQGEYGYQRYPQGYEQPQAWYGHERTSESPRSSQDLGSLAVSSSDPSPRQDVAPRDDQAPVYEPAQGIYGFQRHLTPPAPATGADPALTLVLTTSHDFDGPQPDTSNSLERIFEEGVPRPATGDQRTTTPSPNLPAFLEKLTSSSESEDSATRNRQRRPTESARAVRLPRNRFYSMEEMCTTAPSQQNLALSSSRVSIRTSDQQCYLPWTCRAPIPFRNPDTGRCVDYTEPPLVDMEDQSSVPTPSTPRTAPSDTARASPTEPATFIEAAGDGAVDAPTTIPEPPFPPLSPPRDEVSPRRPPLYTPPSRHRSLEDTGPKKMENLAGESKSVEEAHNDIEDMLQRLRSLESRLHSVEDESQSKDRQIQELLARLENLVAGAGADSDAELTHRLQVAMDTIARLEECEAKLTKELEESKHEIDKHVAELESFQGRSEEIELRLSESQRQQAAGDQQVQQLAHECGQLTAERNQLNRQLQDSAADVKEKEARVSQLLDQMQEYRDRVEQLERDMPEGEEVQLSTAPSEITAQVAAENQRLRGRLEELEEEASSDEQWREQVQEAAERARAMERALDQLSSEKRTEEERRREVEAQLMQMVRRTSSVSHPVLMDEVSAPEETSASSADELLDPQLCRRLQQLLVKLHQQGLQALNLTELRFVKTYASPSQLTPRPPAAEPAVDVADMDAATLLRAISRLTEILAPKEQNISTQAQDLAKSLKKELSVVQELQRNLAAEHDNKLALAERLGEERSESGALETNLAHMLTVVAHLRGGDERPDKTRDSIETQLQQFAAAKTATQQLVDREQKIMQELSRTTDAGCKDLERVLVCLAKLGGAGDQLASVLGRESAMLRLSEQLIEEHQRCRDMLACLECERGRAAQLCQELHQTRQQAVADSKSGDKLEDRVTELTQRRTALSEQVDAVSAEVRLAESEGLESQPRLEQQLKRLLQDVRQVEGAVTKAADDMQKPDCDQADSSAMLQRSTADTLTTVTTVVDSNVEAERLRTRIIQLACALSSRKEAPPEPAATPVPAPTPAAEPMPAADTEHWQEQLESERAKWGQERGLLQLHIEQLDGELERLRAAVDTTPGHPPAAQGQGDDGRVQEAHSRYLRAESYRRALCWQKHYLMILLGGYQDTESMTLDKMEQLTGGCFVPDYRRLLEPLRKFRAAAWAVVAMLRMQSMVRRWRSGHRRGGRGSDHRRTSSKRGSHSRTHPAAGRQSQSRSQNQYQSGAYSRSQSRSQSQSQNRSQDRSRTSGQSRSQDRSLMGGQSRLQNKKLPFSRPKPKPTTGRRQSVTSKNEDKKNVRMEAKTRSPSPKKPPSPSGIAASPSRGSEKQQQRVEFADEEVTPRGQSSTEAEELANVGTAGTLTSLGSLSTASTLLLDDTPLSAARMFSDLCISSDESDCIKFFTDYDSQLVHLMDGSRINMECGTTGSMPNLAGCDVRSVMTVSDVESDELERYLEQFDSLIINNCYSSNLSTSSLTSPSPRTNR